MTAAAPLVVTLDHELRVRRLPAELRERLVKELEIDNPKYLEAQRLGRWTRGMAKKLKFYRRFGGDGLIVPRGYMRRLADLCRGEGVAFRIDDRRRTLPEAAFDFDGRLKPFQERAVSACLAKDFGVLSAPTGAGKTVMALAMVARRRQPALVVVHTRELLAQWVERIGRFLKIPAESVGTVGGGKVRMGDAVTVAMVQTLYKHTDRVVPRVGFLVVDECHRCPSRTFTEAVSAFDSRYMLGLSATPWRRDKLSKLIFWHLGNVQHEIDKRYLVARGDVLDAEVVFRETDFMPYADAVHEYSRMLSELTLDDRRNRLIADDVAREAQRADGTILVLTDRRRHCETLCSLLRFRHDLRPEKLTGDMPDAERRALLERLEAGEVPVLVATGQLMGEGFDSRRLTTLFLATPIRFSGRVLQYLGRILRPAPGKEKAKVYDYVDGRVEVLAAAARARRRVYEGGPEVRGSGV